jgi:hypothetical protein
LRVGEAVEGDAQFVGLDVGPNSSERGFRRIPSARDPTTSGSNPSNRSAGTLGRWFGSAKLVSRLERVGEDPLMPGGTYR